MVVVVVMLPLLLRPFHARLGHGVGINSFHSIPMVVDAGSLLWQSWVICREGRKHTKPSYNPNQHSKLSWFLLTVGVQTGRLLDPLILLLIFTIYTGGID